MINIILFNLHVLIRVINRRILKNKHSHGRETNKKLSEKVNSYNFESICVIKSDSYFQSWFFLSYFFRCIFMDMHVVHALTLAGHAPFHLFFVSIFLPTFFSYNNSFHTTFKGNTIFESWIWSYDWSWWLYKTKYMYEAIFKIAPENEVMSIILKVTSPF